mmetsp:Transcript_43888/g.58189  ORF Transcript_43888/g.58189 Transcript_43888/m.58189 type:complete len:225 (-) Transcript_43888:1487-2161(-)
MMGIKNTRVDSGIVHQDLHMHLAGVHVAIRGDIGTCQRLGRLGNLLQGGQLRLHDCPTQYRASKTLSVPYHVARSNDILVFAVLSSLCFLLLLNILVLKSAEGGLECTSLLILGKVCVEAGKHLLKSALFARLLLRLAHFLSGWGSLGRLGQSFRNDSLLFLVQFTEIILLLFLRCLWRGSLEQLLLVALWAQITRFCGIRLLDIVVKNRIDARLLAICTVERR